MAGLRESVKNLCTSICNTMILSIYTIVCTLYGIDIAIGISKPDNGKSLGALSPRKWLIINGCVGLAAMIFITNKYHGFVGSFLFMWGVLGSIIVWHINESLMYNDIMITYMGWRIIVEFISLIMLVLLVICF